MPKEVQVLHGRDESPSSPTLRRHDRVTAAEFRKIAQKAHSQKKYRRSEQLRDQLVGQLRRAGYRGDIVFEHKFHSVRQWRLDLFFPVEHVAIEIEGGVYARSGAKRCRVCGQMPQGGHNTGAGYEKNVEKYNEARLAGITLIQATSKTIESGRAASWTLRALAMGAHGEQAKVFDVQRAEATDAGVLSPSQQSEVGISEQLHRVLAQESAEVGARQRRAKTGGDEAPSQRRVRARGAPRRARTVRARD